MEINKPESKYISREVKVNGGTSYEILFSSLEPELQQKLRESEIKSTALVGYEIMMSENTQCIASALRNVILNLGLISKVVYQDNGKAFKSKYFQHCDFEEGKFNGVYANLGIHSVFAKPYNARAKVIERFFFEFQEEFEKLMPS